MFPPVGAVEPGRVVVTDSPPRVQGAIRADVSLRPIGVGVAWRTTVIILFFAGLVGVLVVLASGIAAAHEERQRLQRHLSELMAAVEPAAAQAASAEDLALAGQVALGLLRNAVVARVVIRVGERELVAKGERSSGAGLPEPAMLTHPLSSPGDPARQVGELQVWPAAAAIDRAVISYSRHIALILGVQLVVVMMSIAWVVLNVVTRPVKKLSDDLHRLRVDGGQQVMLPAGHRGDEIGRLASDINGLIVRMGDSLRAERDMRHQREEVERRFELVLENVSAGVFTLDGDGMLQDWNPWLSRMLGLPARGDATRSYALRELLGDHSSRLDALMVRALADNRPAGADFEIERGADAPMWLHLQLNPLPGKLQGIVNDVSEQKRAELTAVTVAERDPLTGLFNLRSIEHRLTEALAALPDAGGLAVMVVDLDGFGEVNSRYGHDAGDRVLITVARQLEAVVRRSDLVARVGSDEFVVALCALESADTARFVAAKIVSTLARPIELGDDGQLVVVGASVGVVYTSSPGDVPQKLLRRADDAMCDARRAGRSQFRLEPGSG